MMPAVNGIQLTHGADFTGRFNDFTLLAADNCYHQSAISKCESGSVLVDTSLDQRYFLNEIDSYRIRNVINRIAKSDYPNCSSLIRRAVVKNGIVKKFHLDGFVGGLLERQDQPVFAKLIAVTNHMSKKLSHIAGNNEIYSYQTILYPSTTLGRPLHLDRHDKSRSHQDCRSIKAFMNLSPNSFRIWGIGPTRSFLIERLNQMCDRQGLPRINFSSIDSSKRSYPSWFDFKWDGCNLNHPVSIINEYLNNNFLSKADIKGQFDIVYYDSFAMLVVDSKQVSHKPMYGELGVSVDMVYNKIDSLVKVA